MLLIDIGMDQDDPRGRSRNPSFPGCKSRKKAGRFALGKRKCIDLQFHCINIHSSKLEQVKNRNERLMEIRRLIGRRNISSQEELMKLLGKKGYVLTQATLSRDLKYLKVAKMPDNRAGYVYVLADKEQVVKEADMPGTGFNGLISIDFAQGMALLKTLPGHAGSIAYNIDSLNAYEIAGTIAGDDTILLIPRDGVSRADLTKLLRLRLPGLIREMVN
jgi:transcriptional regulator of arginine metabolism